MKHLGAVICIVFLTACSEDSNVAEEGHTEAVRYLIERMKAGDLDSNEALVIEADKPKYRNIVGSEKLNEPTEKSRTKWTWISIRWPLFGHTLGGKSKESYEHRKRCMIGRRLSPPRGNDASHCVLA